MPRNVHQIDEVPVAILKERLQEVHVHNLTVAHVKGYGKHDEFFAFRSSHRYALTEIFCETPRADAIAQVIMGTAHTGQPGDGVVAGLPIETMCRIRRKAEVRLDDFRKHPSQE